MLQNILNFAGIAVFAASGAVVGVRKGFDLFGIAVMAVLTGVMLSLVVYLYRSARPALRTMGFDRQGAGRPFVVLGAVGEPGPAPAGAMAECPQLKLLRMEGSVWFGAVAHVADRLRGLREHRREARQRHGER